MIAGIAGALAASSLALFWLPHLQQPNEPVTVQLELLTDILSFAGGVAVRIEDQSGWIQYSVTDANGRAQPLLSEETMSLDVAVRETVLPDGIGLGQRFDVAVPMFDDYEELGPEVGLLPCFFEIERTVPVAVPVVLAAGSGTEGAVWAEGRTSLWSIRTPGHAPGYRFQAFVAPLASGSAVSASAAYHGSEVPEDKYIAGLAIGSRAVGLGGAGDDSTTGFTAVMNCKPFLSGGISHLAVDAYYFQTTPPPVAQPGEPISAPQPLVVQFLSLEGGYAGIHVAGSLPGGWLLLALRGANGIPGSTMILESQPPSFGTESTGSVLSLHVPASEFSVPNPASLAMRTDRSIAGSLDSRFGAHDAPDIALIGLPRSAVVKNCIPIPADPPAGWSCEPPEATSDDGCDQPVIGSTVCDHNNTPTGVIHCESPGNKTGKRKARARSHTTSIPSTIAGTAITSSHTFSSSTETFESHDHLPGEHGLGQCYQTFLQRTFCYATAIETHDLIRWYREAGEPWQAEHVPCGDVRNVLLICSQDWHLQETCSRTP